MNKGALKKNIGHHVRIRPVAKRFVDGQNGIQIPPCDDPWLIEDVDSYGVRLSNTQTGHGTVLGNDHIHHFSTDAALGRGHGFLTLNVQLHIGGVYLWSEPTFRPGQPLPDQFGNISGWKRENDAAYIRSLFPNTAAAPIMQQARSVNSELGFGLLACICIGLGLLIVNEWQ